MKEFLAGVAFIACIPLFLVGGLLMMLFDYLVKKSNAFDEDYQTTYKNYYE